MSNHNIATQHQSHGLLDPAMALRQCRLGFRRDLADRCAPDSAGVDKALVEVDGASGFGYGCHCVIPFSSWGIDCVSNRPGVRPPERFTFPAAALAPSASTQP